MAKRPANALARNCKKQKLAEDVKELWDDTIDDDCFLKLATQIFNEENVECTQRTQSNVSVLPSYEHFKQRSHCSSTQNVMPFPSAPIEPNSVELKETISRLHIQYAEKEGEVAILRTQLKETKANLLVEQTKKQKEFSEKLALAHKDINSINSQLIFKNLEIANLKQKVLDVSKQSLGNIVNGAHDSTKVVCDIMVNNSIKVNCNKIDTPNELEKPVETQILLESIYPLRSRISPGFFQAPSQEKYIVETKFSHLYRNTLPYLHNQMFQENHLITSGPRVTVINNKEINLEYIYPEILQLTQSSREELNSEESEKNIDKIICTSLQLLHDFYDFLKCLEKNYRTEDIQQLDSLHLKNQDKHNIFECDILEATVKNEIGVKAGRTIYFLAVLLPYSTYLKNYLILHKLVYSKSGIWQSFPCLQNNNKSKQTTYLTLLSNIVRSIVHTRVADLCSCFLSSTVHLLTNICKSSYFINVYDSFCGILSEILFTRPNSSVMYQLLFLFTQASKYPKFMKFLCDKPPHITYNSNKEKKMLYFNAESCRFAIFVAVFKNTLLNVDMESVFIDINLNILSFIYNIFVTNIFWMHHEKKHKCVCLPNLYQLGIEVIHNTLLKYKSTKSTEYTDSYRSIFKCGIKILHLMTFNSYELTVKYMEDFSQYREICNSLTWLQSKLKFDEAIICDLQKLNISDEIPTLPSEKLTSL